MMRVVATAKGYFGCFREVGDEFEVPVGTKGSWFTAVVESKPAVKAKRKDAESDPAGDEASEAI